MKKLGYLVLSTVLLLCLASCKNGFGPKNNEKKGTVTLNINQNARTMMPNGFTLNLNQVNEWTVEFVNKDTPGSVYKDSLFFSDFPKEFNYPEGSYDVHVTGQFTKNLNVDGTWKDVSFNYKGSSEVTVTAETDTDLTVFVSLYQAENAEGSFQYNITLKENVTKDLISEGDTTPTNNNTTEVSINGYKFRSYLTSTSDSSKKVDLLLNMNITAREDLRQYYTNLRISSDVIPAGYYYFTLEYEKDGVIKVFDNIPDPVVLIIDGLKVFPADLDMDDYSFNPVKNIYVSNNGKNNLGLTPQNARDLELTLKELKEGTQGDEWKAINLYFIEERRLGTVSVLDLHKGVAPLINVDYIPTTSGDGKLITLYVSEKDESILEIKDGQLYYLDSSAETILYADKEKYSEAPAEVTVNFVPEYDYWDSRFYLANTKLTINNAEGVYGTIAVRGSDIATAYTDESTPILTLNYDSEVEDDLLNSLNIEFYDVSDDVENASAYGIQKFIKEKNDLPVVEFYTYYEGKGNISVQSAVPSFSVEDISSHSGNYEMEEGDKAKFTIKITEDALLNIGSKVTWTYNDHIITGPFTVSEDNTDDWKTVEVDVYNSLYTWDGYNYVTAIIEYNGIKVSKNNSFLVERNPGQGIIYFNFIDNYSAEPNPGWRSTIKDINGNFIQAPFSQSRYNEEELYAYCYDDFFNLYVAVKTEKWSNYYSFYKYEYSKAKLGYKPERKLLGIVNSEYKLPLRITVRPTKSEMFILTKIAYNSDYFDNVLYKLDISEVLNEDEINEENIASVSKSWADIAVRVQSDGKNNDFDSITAIAYNSNTDHYYIAGEKKTPIFLEDGDLHFKNDYGEDDDPADGYSNYTYSVKEYRYSNLKMEPIADCYSYSYTDLDILASAEEPGSPYAKLITPSSMPEENQYTLYLTKLHCPITDISFLNGNMAMLRIFTSYSQYRTATVEGGETSWGYNNYDNGKYCFSVVYKPENEEQRIIDFPEKLEGNPIYPVRILAIKKDELVFADGDVDYQGYGITHTINLNNNSISSSMHYSDYYYGYKFDNVTGGSNGSYNWSYHDVKVISVDGE